jgi:hypothetical protein
MRPCKEKNIIFVSLFLFSSTVVSANLITDGYMDKISYEPGDISGVFINAAGVYNNSELYLLNENNLIVDSVSVNLSPQNISSSNTAPWENGFGYNTSFSYVIPLNLASGIYNWENKIYFIVKNPVKNSDITIIYPSNTEAAYNNAGGKSLYNSGSSNYSRANAVSFLRSLTATELAYNRLYSDGFMKWISSSENYSYQIISDQDMDDYSEIQNSKLIVVIGHSEYWSRTGRLNFDQFVNNGKDAVILSGNTMWWQVRYSPDHTKLICYKDFYADTISDIYLKTINWTEASLNYPCLTSIGCDYVHGAYPPSNLSVYNGWNGYKILSPDSPILAGTGLNNHDTLYCKSREWDGTLSQGTNLQGDPVLDSTSLNFCKIELIGYERAQNPTINSSYMGYGTFIAFKKNYFSGNVINVAASNWCADTQDGYAGGFAGPDSLKIKRITSNIFDLLLSQSTIYATPNACTLTTSSADVVNVSPFHVFPNPTSGKLTFHTNTTDLSSLQIEVYNSFAIRILAVQFPGFNDENLDISNFADGIYTYLVRDQDSIIDEGRIILAH